MTNRRSLVLALTAAALTPTVTFAAEAGDIFGGILQGIRDRKEREWYEKNRDEGRWDATKDVGTASTSGTVRTANATRATNGKRNFAGATTKSVPAATGAPSAAARPNTTIAVTIDATAVTTVVIFGAMTGATIDATAVRIRAATIGVTAGMIGGTTVADETFAPQSKAGPRGEVFPASPAERRRKAVFPFRRQRRSRSETSPENPSSPLPHEKIILLCFCANYARNPRRENLSL